MTYTIRELIDELEDLASDWGDDIEVRLAHQPEWPFEYGISKVVVEEAGDTDDEDDEEEGEPTSDLDEREMVCYIAEGAQLGYLPGIVERALEWGRRR